MCLEPAFKGQNQNIEKKALWSSQSWFVNISATRTWKIPAGLAWGFGTHYFSYFALLKERGKFPWLGP